MDHELAPPILVVERLPEQEQPCNQQTFHLRLPTAEREAMKQVTVTPYCGNTLVHGDERVVATVERVVSIDRAGPELIDLCTECDHGIVGALLAVVEADGQPAPKPTKGRRPSAPGVADTVCPECGQTGFNSRHSRNAHIRDRHGKSIRDYA